MKDLEAIWIQESPVTLVEGCSVPFTIAFPFATTVSASPTIEVYKDGNSTDVASTYMPSGTHSVSGNTLTMKNLTSLVPGKYVIVIIATVDGVADVWKLQANCIKKEALQ